MQRKFLSGSKHKTQVFIRDQKYILVFNKLVRNLSISSCVLRGSNSVT